MLQPYAPKKTTFFVVVAIGVPSAIVYFRLHFSTSIFSTNSWRTFGNLIKNTRFSNLQSCLRNLGVPSGIRAIVLTFSGIVLTFAHRPVPSGNRQIVLTFFLIVLTLTTDGTVSIFKSESKTAMETEIG